MYSHCCWPIPDLTCIHLLRISCAIRNCPSTGGSKIDGRPIAFFEAPSELDPTTRDEWIRAVPALSNPSSNKNVKVRTIYWYVHISTIRCMLIYLLFTFKRRHFEEIYFTLISTLLEICRWYSVISSHSFIILLGSKVLIVFSFISVWSAEREQKMNFGLLSISSSCQEASRCIKNRSLYVRVSDRRSLTTSMNKERPGT